MHYSKPAHGGRRSARDRRVPTSLGKSPLRHPPGRALSDFVTWKGETFARIRQVDALAPFLMSIASDSDFWLFVGSHSAFTAGRVDADHALFPYQTADKIMQSPDASGCLSIFRVRDGGHDRVWEPWRPSGRVYRLERNLYKSVYGTSVVFEETNHDLQLRFRWKLTTCERFGLVREATLENLSQRPRSIQYLDGWTNLIAPSVTQDLYSSLSFLALAYMRHEQTPEGVGIFRLNAAIVDRAEPAESLRAACAWSIGHRRPTVLLSTRQADAFRAGHAPEGELEIRGQMGAYLVADQVALKAGGSRTWYTVADTHLDHAAVERLQAACSTPAATRRAILESVAANRDGFRKRMAGADGLQQTADPAASWHHFTNVQFNCMRGGTFPDGYRFPGADFARFVRARNRLKHEQHRAWLEALPGELSLGELQERIEALNDVHMRRLSREYMPLTFSRRHGDPSRPWNRFNIHIKDEHGEPVYSYQGNWRDIFQNWESLGRSYPGYLRQMFTAFLNATTADGYNPYRVSREGIDWEAPEPGNPWGHYGYWGDHQIIYLLRLLEGYEGLAPLHLAGGLSDRQYVYAHVPYEIVGYRDLLANPADTIRFNHTLHEELMKRAKSLGGDGKLIMDGESPRLVNLAEKLLIPVLAKLSNLVPGGGIWLNTQRPEWNDANNALAGWGLSIVTTCYIRRYLAFLDKRFEEFNGTTVELSASTATFLRGLASAFASPTGSAMEPDARFKLMGRLGKAGELHRRAVYALSFGPAQSVSVAEIRRFIARALEHVDATIRANRRRDGLYHSYNVMHLEDRRAAHLEYFYPMLEGQVAVLSSGLLKPAEAIRLLDELRAGPLYREDQKSYILYPDRTLQPFTRLNTFRLADVRRIPLVRKLLNAGDKSVVVAGQRDRVHFSADLQNAAALSAALDKLARARQWKTAVDRDRRALLDLWEKLFNHRTFTGRSGTFFSFEGLGCIYWHMVTKLLLAVQELHDQTLRRGERMDYVQDLADHYMEIRRGLGFQKSADEYGAFPTDPYSHTPKHAGAQQPGMTGQVKEEILTRWGELGVRMEGGHLHFEPRLLSRGEFMASPQPFQYVDIGGAEQTRRTPANSLAFTCCQVPVTYRLADRSSIVLELANGLRTEINGSSLDAADSTAILMRTGEIASVTVSIPKATLLP